MNIRWCILGLAVAAIAFAGCGGGGEGVEAVAGTHAEHAPESPKEIRVTLDGVMGPEDLGILMAHKRGFFKDAGINVWVGSPIEPNRPVSYVAKGPDPIGIAQMPQVVIAREKGLPIVAVGSVIAKPLAAFMWLKGSGIHEIADLKGKTIGVPGIPYQERFLQSVLARAGLSPGDVKIQPLAYEATYALFNEQVDAMFGGLVNQEQLELEGLGAKVVVTPVGALGIPPYEELVVIARRQLVKEDPQLIRNFLAAMQRGTAVARKNPRASVNLFMQAAGIELTRKVVERQVRTTLPLLSTSGQMDLGSARRLVRWMHDEQLIKEELPTATLMTNAYQR